jgi:hypothetical protein
MTRTKISDRRALESSTPVQGRKLKTHKPTQTRSDTNCIFFAVGKCSRGENCSFQHLNPKESSKKISVECRKECRSEKLIKSLCSISLSGEPKVEMRSKEKGRVVLDEKSTGIELKQKRGSLALAEKITRSEMKEKEKGNMVLDKKSYFVQGILTVRPKLVQKK